MIERDIYVGSARRVEPIRISENSTMDYLALNIRDYEIPEGTNAIAYSRPQNSNVTFEAGCVVYDKTITLRPPVGFFLPGRNDLQIKAMRDGFDLLSLHISVIADEDLSNQPGGSPGAILTQLQRAEAMVANIPQYVQASVDAYIATDPAVHRVNILDNSHFLINQRGQTAYPNAGGSYTVDRWIAYGDVIVATGGAASRLHIEGQSSGGFILAQKIDNAAMLSDQLVTLSFDTFGTDVRPVILTENGFTGISESTVGSIHTLTAIIPAGTTSLTVGLTVDAGNFGIDIYRAKLELGGSSTLAGDPRPSYADDLLRCQRYYYKVISGNRAIEPTGFVNGQYRLAFPLPVKMRTTPNVVIEKYSDAYPVPSVIISDTYCFLYGTDFWVAKSIEFVADM